MTTIMTQEPDTEPVVTEDTAPETTDDPERAAHIVIDPDRERDDVVAYLLEARIESKPVVAICGYVFVPRESSLGKPVCSKCWDIYNSEDRSDHTGGGEPIRE